MPKKIKLYWNEDLTRQGKPSLPAKRKRVQLIGAPDDRAVMNVGGRLGAARGPQAFREMFADFVTGIDGFENVELFKGFDIEPGHSIEAAHENLSKAVQDCLKKSSIPLVIGGSHDFGYPHIQGASLAFKGKVALINIDAHLDVRPVGEKGITSGSPFFLALENGVVKPENFIEFGIQAHCNATEFVQYLKKKKVKIKMLEDVRAGKGSPAQELKKLIDVFAKKKLKVVISFDIDAVKMADAPGVSAPQVDGFTAQDFLEMMTVCGEHPAVCTVGFFELAPILDSDKKTVRLAATAAHRYISALGR